MDARNALLYCALPSAARSPQDERRASALPGRTRVLPAVTRILREDHDGRCAAALFQRYQQLFIGSSIARAILRLSARPDDPAEGAAFQRGRQVWETQGGYIEPLGTEELGSWIRSSAYIIAEAADPSTNGGETFRPVADCIFRLPDDERWVIPHLGEAPDEIFDRPLYENIMADGPAASAIIDYLGVLPGWADKRLAGDARYAGMHEVMKLNAARPATRQIRHVVGMTFSVQGIALPDPDEPSRFGKEIPLSELGQTEIVNRASMKAISSSRRCPARLFGKWAKAPPVPVEIDGRRYGLLVHWYCHVRTPDIPPRELA